jgi:hypothetical protein
MYINTCIHTHIQELFTDHGGPIKKAEVFYKQDGSSTGQAVSITIQS